MIRNADGTMSPSRSAIPSSIGRRMICHCLCRNLLLTSNDQRRITRTRRMGEKAPEKSKIPSFAGTESPFPEIVLVLDFSAGEQTQVDALFEFDCRFRNVGLFRPESPPWRLVRWCQFGLAAL